SESSSRTTDLPNTNLSTIKEAQRKKTSVSKVSKKPIPRGLHKFRDLNLQVVRRKQDSEVGSKKIEEESIPRNKAPSTNDGRRSFMTDSSGNRVEVIEPDEHEVAIRNQSLEEAPSTFDPDGLFGPVSSRLRSRFAMDSRFKRIHNPIDEDFGIYPPTNKRRHHIAFLERIVASGGIYLTSLKQDEKVGDIDATNLEESIPRIMGILDEMDEDDIDWVPTLYSLAEVEKEFIPKSYKQAMQSTARLNWGSAMDSEMAAHGKMVTFGDLMKLPEGKTAIGCIWVFAKKDSGIYKARLVALGNHQKEGIDYDLTFSPVIRYTSLRLVLAIAARLRLGIRAWDVSTAFLNGKLEEEIYIRQPEGYVVEGKEHLVYRLNRSLYGLKQSPRVWHETVRQEIEKIDFKQSKAEPCLFYKHVKAGLVMLALYVDDMLVFGPTDGEIEKVKSYLFKRFKMKDLGVPKKFLGMNFKVSKGVIEISLEDYINKMLDIFEDSVRPTKAPISKQDKLKPRAEDEEACDATLFRSMIGKFLYAAMVARPDISYATSFLSRFLVDPSVSHLKA
ncbi:hypothetical protein OXX69_012265, partial [Metschnikowia pulcherrima]